MSAHRIVTRVVVAWAAVVWAAMLPAAAYAVTLPADRTAAQIFALTVYLFGSAICHQRAERSFYLFAQQLPVCARCTGLYAGAAVAAVLYLGFLRRPAANPPEAVPTGTARLVLILAALPMVTSLVYEWTTGDVPSNMLRAGTGIAFGGAVAYVILAALDSTR
jgi:uncharacterized membrane protein